MKLFLVEEGRMSTSGLCFRFLSQKDDSDEHMVIWMSMIGMRSGSFQLYDQHQLYSFFSLFLRNFTSSLTSVIFPATLVFSLNGLTLPQTQCIGEEDTQGHHFSSVCSTLFPFPSPFFQCLSQISWSYLDFSLLFSLSNFS